MKALLNWNPYLKSRALRKKTSGKYDNYEQADVDVLSKLVSDIAGAIARAKAQEKELVARVEGIKDNIFNRAIRNTINTQIVAIRAQIASAQAKLSGYTSQLQTARADVAKQKATQDTLNAGLVAQKAVAETQQTKLAVEKETLAQETTKSYMMYAVIAIAVIISVVMIIKLIKN